MLPLRELGMPSRSDGHASSESIKLPRSHLGAGGAHKFNLIRLQSKHKKSCMKAAAG
ncbi:hypothetical protein NQZ68_022792 [Dissostichus eleginoides]|nr:hypothetical protein NQZ68_022792 [Dissostichus eleginoides]